MVDTDPSGKVAELTFATFRHQVEHMYAKTGVSTRAGPLFAMAHRFLSP